jgi:hypothetical protein
MIRVPLILSILLTLTACDSVDRELVKRAQAVEAEVCKCSTSACMLSAVAQLPSEEELAVINDPTRVELKLSQNRMMACVAAMKAP